jgi:thiamine-monophosphate kinase
LGFHVFGYREVPYSLNVLKSPRNAVNRSERPGELALIREIRTRVPRFSRGELTLGIGDDCALLRPRPGEELAITTDLSIAGRHFRLDMHPPQVVGHRTLARGLSDLAAMGARPVAAFVSLGLPRDLIVKRGRRPAWVERFMDGLLALAETHNTPLAGGDLAESPVALADVVLVGAVPKNKALLRSGARAGDALYVTGSLGGAAAGLARLEELGQADGFGDAGSIMKKTQDLLASHLHPEPRIAQGLWLRRKGLATAAIDLSDGLSTDLGHLCDESGVAAEVDASALPLHPAATLEQALNGGEDYELLFAAPEAAKLPRQIAGVSVTRIGRIVRRRRGSPAVTLETNRGSAPLEPQGWQHFS